MIRPKEPRLRLDPVAFDKLLPCQGETRYQAAHRLVSRDLSHREPKAPNRFTLHFEHHEMLRNVKPVLQSGSLCILLQQVAKCLILTRDQYCLSIMLVRLGVVERPQPRGHGYRPPTSWPR